MPAAHLPEGPPGAPGGPACFPNLSGWARGHVVGRLSGAGSVAQPPAGSERPLSGFASCFSQTLPVLGATSPSKARGAHPLRKVGPCFVVAEMASRGACRAYFEGMMGAEPHALCHATLGDPSTVLGSGPRWGTQKKAGPTCPFQNDLWAVEGSVPGRRQTRPCRKGI